MSYAICEQQIVDQPAHPRRLISAFVVCCLESITSIVAIHEMSRIYLASVAEQSGLSLSWSHTTEDRVSYDMAPCHEKTCHMPYVNNKSAESALCIRAV